jgi:hypothetical protein
MPLCELLKPYWISMASRNASKPIRISNTTCKYSNTPESGSLDGEHGREGKDGQNIARTDR